MTLHGESSHAAISPRVLADAGKAVPAIISALIGQAKAFIHSGGRHQRRERFAGLRVMERAALRAWAEQRERGG